MTKFRTFKLQELFNIEKTKSFNKNEIRPIIKNEEIFDYVTRTSKNMGVLAQTSFVNSNNINDYGTFSLGLLQMDCFYRKRRWYAGQFVRKIIPKFNLDREKIIYFTTIFKKLKTKFLSYLIRDIDNVFNNTEINLPVNRDNKIDWEYIKNYIKKLEHKYINKVEMDYNNKINIFLRHLDYSNIDDIQLNDEDKKILNIYQKSDFDYFSIDYLFSYIKRGKRMKSIDRISGNLPFVTAGTENQGISSYIDRNTTHIFPSNGITIDMFGNCFYRGYEYGADDHITVLYSSNNAYSRYVLQYIATIINVAIRGQFTYSKNFYPKDTYNLTLKLPIDYTGTPNYPLMENYIKIIQKKIINNLKNDMNVRLDIYKSII
ncbi:hypothetical protein DY124_07810 [Apilactobacillus micheneri]|uniref:restriction endonuclease subunit S n=1 Tax=Apilactobacillus micheneri TaxID=1899430 RepID=UPI00112CAF75|nr:restriction endonuclease subunit S [Apilactobacillus micheneri]TPR42315.1 hypothetical protein DY124_07810 [Apilactobacillus micheneri]TPR47010.1 hypothetical protein DY125_07820 [Apilactobacillus micheneri]